MVMVVYPLLIVFDLLLVALLYAALRQFDLYRGEDKGASWYVCVALGWVIVAVGSGGIIVWLGAATVWSPDVMRGIGPVGQWLLTLVGR